MAEYIERETLLTLIAERKRNTCNGTMSCMQMERMVEGLPAAEVEPVRQGQWEGSADGYADGVLVYDMWRCSECGFDADGAEEKPEWKFCPNCGARMDGGADDI